MDAGQGGAGQVDSRQVQAGQVSVAKIDPGEIGVREIGAHQPGAAQIGVRQVGARQVGARQVGVAQVGAGQVGIRQVGIVQPGIPQIHAAEDDARQERADMPRAGRGRHALLLRPCSLASRRMPERLQRDAELREENIELGGVDVRSARLEARKDAEKFVIRMVLARRPQQRAVGRHQMGGRDHPIHPRQRLACLLDHAEDDVVVHGC